MARTSDHGQEIFDGVKFGFRWVGDWYEYDGTGAEKIALKARNDLAKLLKAEGRRPIKSSLGLQLRKKGGIGTGKPEIEILTKAYMVTW